MYSTITHLNKQPISSSDIERLLVVLGTELSGVVGVAIRGEARHLLSVGLIASRLEGAASDGVLVVVPDIIGLLTDAARRGRAVHRTVGAGADLALAIDADGAVGSSAEGKVSGRGGDVNGVVLDSLVELVGVDILSKGLLAEVEGLALHADVVAEILVAVHAGGELDEGGVTDDAVSDGLGAGRRLVETSGGVHTRVPGVGVTVIGSGRVSRTGDNVGSEPFAAIVRLAWPRRLDLDV